MLAGIFDAFLAASGFGVHCPTKPMKLACGLEHRIVVHPRNETPFTSSYSGS